MLEKLIDVVQERTENVRSITDVFSGTGVVAKAFKDLGYLVNSNDILFFSYVLNKGTLDQNAPINNDIKDVITHLNNLSIENAPWFEIEKAFIYQNYSPHDDCERMYFQCDNAVKIDLAHIAGSNHVTS